MKKYSTILFLLLITQFFAQAPQKMSYQAVLRNANNDLITNTTVGMRISILQGSTSGTSVYVETQNPTTNANGLVSLEIGTGTSVTGTFATINWANGPFYIKTETAPSGGTNYTITGTNQLLSVPYALYSENSKQQGKTTIILENDITDAQAAAQISKELGPNTENILIRNTTQLTSVDFSGVTSLVKIVIDNNSALSSVNFSSLTNIYEDIYIDRNSVLSSIIFNNLTKSNLISISYNNNLSLVSFNSLTTTSGGISIGNNTNLQTFSFGALTNSRGISILYNTNLQTISFNSLITDSGGISIGNNINLQTVSFNSLTHSEGIGIENNINLQSINFNSLTTTSGGIMILDNSNMNSASFPSLSSCGQVFINRNSNLSSISLPVLSIYGGNFDVSNNSLTSLNISSLSSINMGQDSFQHFVIGGNRLSSSIVNALLNKFLTVTPLSGKDLYLNGQNPPAPPTGQGIIDLSTLINMGNTVITD